MQVRISPREMHPGDPYCAPQPGVLAEAYVTLLRKLSNTEAWSQQVMKVFEDLDSTDYRL